MGEKFYAFDGGEYEFVEAETLEEAVGYAEDMLQEYRDNCDPEWPMGVTDIYVLRGERNPDSDDQFEDCKPIYRATECDRVDLDPEEAEECGYSYSCDYKMQEIQ